MKLSIDLLIEKEKPFSRRISFSSIVTLVATELLNTCIIKQAFSVLNFADTKDQYAFYCCRQCACSRLKQYSLIKPQHVRRRMSDAQLDSGTGSSARSGSGEQTRGYRPLCHCQHGHGFKTSRIRLTPPRSSHRAELPHQSLKTGLSGVERSGPPDGGPATGRVAGGGRVADRSMRRIGGFPGESAVTNPPGSAQRKGLAKSVWQRQATESRI